jgi:hypothetical protein
VSPRHPISATSPKYRTTSIATRQVGAKESEIPEHSLVRLENPEDPDIKRSSSGPRNSLHHFEAGVWYVVDSAAAVTVGCSDRN